MIKVYYAKIDYFLDEEVLKKKISLVCMQRRDKILRCKNSKDKARSLVAGLLLKYALIIEGYNYDLIQFQTNEHGKIELVDSPNLFVNLSHSGGYAVCVVARQSVGVDIEDNERFQDDVKKERLLRIAQRSCTLSELEKLEKLDDIELVNFFMKLWTRKESYAKAKGLGMQIGFSTLDTLITGFYEECVIDERYHLCVATIDNSEDVCFCDCTETIEMIG